MEKIKEKRLNLIIVILLVGLAAAGIYRYQMNSRDRAESIAILTYHRLCSDEEYKNISGKDKNLWVRESDFREEMKWLHDNGYRTLSLDEFYEWYNGRIELPRKSVVITFDDGCKNVIDYGLPVLRQYNQKATMFVIGALVNPTPRTLDGITYVGFDTMREVSRDYPDFDFESHSFDIHQRVNKEPKIRKSTLIDLIKDNEIMERLFKDYDFKYMAYPYGFYTPQYLQSLKKADYKMAFTYNDQIKATRDYNRYLIPRIGIRGDRPPEKEFYKWFR